MLFALATSTLFLISYLIRHYYVPSVPFEGDGVIKSIYYVILFSHIVLAAMIVPLIIITVIPAFKGNLDKHKKIAKWTVPIWLYVSVTGILVYILLYRL